ncbi:voltage-gated potassium channel [Astrocystis sublimbata]|nr:voltage-gated potassium channel [Astrocystis sublimbata]
MMEDADLDQTVVKHAEDTDLHLNQTRWWVASAALPMVAGTLGPVASAFSICALVKPWRQHILPNSDVTKAVFIHDPSWLLAINAVQLVIAVVANFFLLLNMTKRVRFSIAQPITIVGWYISAILLISLCATASGPLLLHPEIEYVWSQAFYYGLFAAIIYFIVASLMVITVWGAQLGHYPRDFELTMSQRTLMLQTISFLTYLLVGALVFSHVEGWLYLDAVYWADVTLFTIGLGDVPLQTKLGRGLMIPYALIGITTLGLVIGSIRSLMLDRGKSRLDARMLEKKRRRIVRRLMGSSKGEVLGPVGGKEAGPHPESESHGSAKGPNKAELERRQKEFQLMRKIQDQTSKRRRWTAMAVSTTTWAILWLVGAKIFQVSEAPYQGWSYFDGIYFSFQAMTTIGYGDMTPVSNAAKAFLVFWSFLALPTLTILISNAGDTVVKGVRDTTMLLGNITILPGERGYRMDIKHFLSRLSFGVLFSEDAIQESPPGFLGAAQPHSDDDEDEDIDEDEDGEGVESARGDFTSQNNKGQGPCRDALSSQDPSSADSNGSHLRRLISSKMNAIRRNAGQYEKEKIEQTSKTSVPDHLPETGATYRLVLIDEIRRVSKHLQHSPQRRYTYKEWAWYLKLIGEDESDKSTHGTPIKDPQSAKDQEKPRQPGGHGDKVDERPKWSWVGYRSPLMDTRDEAEWILDKLTRKLQEELQAAVQEKAAEDGAGSVDDMERRGRAGS